MAKQDDLPPLDMLEKRISAAREAQEPEAKSGPGNATALRSGTELFAGVIVGGFLGYYADAYLGTRPGFLIAGIFLGLAGGVMNIYRATMHGAQLDETQGKDSLHRDETLGE